MEAFPDPGLFTFQDGVKYVDSYRMFQEFATTQQSHQEAVSGLGGAPTVSGKNYDSNCAAASLKEIPQLLESARDELNTQRVVKPLGALMNDFSFSSRQNE
jgi:hypothetical protein